jgi:vancomycin resistance protein YoaR
MSQVDTAAPPTRGPGKGRLLGRLFVGLIAGLVLVGAFGAGALLAYDRQYADRIVPGVTVDGVDVAGLDRAAATALLAEKLAGYADGQVTIRTSLGSATIPYSALGRAADTDRMLDAAFTVSRVGDPVNRAVDGVRSLLDGTTVEPAVTLDPEAVAAAVTAAATRLDEAPVDASAAASKEGFTVTPGVDGQGLDQGPVVDALLAALVDPAAPAELVVDADFAPIEPNVTTAESQAAVARAQLMARDLVVTLGGSSWKIPAATVRSWITFSPTADGGYEPVVDAQAPTKAIAALSKKIDKAAKEATFLLSRGGSRVGVVASKNGRKLDVPATVALAVQAVTARGLPGAAEPPAALEPAVAVVEPKLTTAEARKAAPLMRRVSTWTTFFFSGAANGYSANIFIPARKINGTVVNPGAVFEFWKVVGVPSYAQGYRDGGVIKNGRSLHTGALAGGICSTSTTVFNAAARAGLAILARDNHAYYIARYPLGLDATVLLGSKTVKFRNDTKYPVLIRAYTGRASGGRSFVRFDIWSVPSNRRVVFSRPVVRNIQRARTITRYTSSLRPGVRQQLEFPVNGMDVWVTRVVTDRKTGKVIHKDVFFSNYVRWDGLVMVGKAAATPAPAPTPGTP